VTAGSDEWASTVRGYLALGWPKRNFIALRLPNPYAVYAGCTDIASGIQQVKSASLAPSFTPIFVIEAEDSSSFFKEKAAIG
jgi:hypothetical protein